MDAQTSDELKKQATIDALVDLLIEACGSKAAAKRKVLERAPYSEAQEELKERLKSRG